jgi:hypothetical protein
MFSQTSRDISYDTNSGLLSAECQTSDNQWCRSYLNLNDCLCYGGKDQLKIIPCIGPNNPYKLVNNNSDHYKVEVSFSGTKITVLEKREERSSNWLPVPWTHYTGVWKNRSGEINLDDCVRNREGLLEFVAP